MGCELDYSEGEVRSQLSRPDLPGSRGKTVSGHLDLTSDAVDDHDFWDLGRAAVCDCGTPWTFLLPFLLCLVMLSMLYNILLHRRLGC